jgi:2-polyprenyl-3-methyl-5-hydroxy-6-metoxy-1,4-benzoquinol methylase
MKDDAVHDVVWTKEKVAQFWNYYSTSSSLGEVYFSEQLGDAVLSFVERHTRIDGDVLDYGCGPGFLMEKLMSKHVSCWGLDAVESNLKIVESKFKDRPYFKGAYFADRLPTSIEDEKYDVVFLVETIEHLLPEEIDSVLREIYRITRKGGRIVITTRNEENLEKNKRICPDCGCAFHLMQHVSSWSTHSLSQRMNEIGFHQIACKATTLRPANLLGYMMKLGYMLTNRPEENLIYIGVK